MINFDQTGIVKDRLLIDNVRHTLNIMDYSANPKQPMLMLTLDAEKAFLAIFIPSMWEIWIPSTLIELIKGLYKETNARERVNGTLSETFTLKRGTRPGDPLLPQIFALCIEPNKY